MNPYLYLLLPAIIVSVSGLIFYFLALRGHLGLGTLAAIAAASPWLFFAIMDSRFRLPSGPPWLGWMILLFSVFGPGVLFGGVMAAVALSKDKDKARKTSLLWVAAVGLIAACLHAVACFHYWLAALD
ncbi:MAG: hypothetical protein V4819_18375 [Verrucomicrobiota bacterium]